MKYESNRPALNFRTLRILFRLIPVWACTLFLISPVASRASHMISGAGVIFRSKPEAGAPPIGALMFGTPVQLKESGDFWATVQANPPSGPTGYVAKKFVEPWRDKPSKDDQGFIKKAQAGPTIWEVENRTYGGGYSDFSRCLEWFEFAEEKAPPEANQFCLKDFVSQRRDALERWKFFEPEKFRGLLKLEHLRLVTYRESPYLSSSPSLLKINNHPLTQEDFKTALADFDEPLRSATDAKDAGPPTQPPIKTSFFQKGAESLFVLAGERDAFRLMLKVSWQIRAASLLRILQAVTPTGQAPDLVLDSIDKFVSSKRIPIVIFDFENNKFQSREAKLVYLPSTSKIYLSEFAAPLRGSRYLVFFGPFGFSSAETVVKQMEFERRQLFPAHYRNREDDWAQTFGKREITALTIDIDGDSVIDLMDVERPLDQGDGCFGKLSRVFLNVRGNWHSQLRSYFHRCID